MHTAIHPYQPPPAAEPEFLHIDDALLVLNKPAGLLSVPGRGADKQDSLALRVQAIYPEALFVHRLDMDTSGLMIMARSVNIQQTLNRMFADRQIEKQYTAVVSGLVAQDEGEIELPLICDWPNRPRQIVDHVNGKPALTIYKVVSRDAHTHNTRVQLTPVTGRTHQLRVHMMSLGHSILGDRLYTEDGRETVSRLMLHAWKLKLSHPATHKKLFFENNSPF